MGLRNEAIEDEFGELIHFVRFPPCLRSHSAFGIEHGVAVQDISTQPKAFLMSIDLSRETLVPFGKLARSLPRRRKDRPVAPSTIHRWRKNGLQGIQLEAVKVGGAWYTTHEAFSRFVARLTAASDASPPAAGSVATLAKKGKPQIEKEVW